MMMGLEGRSFSGSLRTWVPDGPCVTFEKGLNLQLQLRGVVLAGGYPGLSGATPR